MKTSFGNSVIEARIEAMLTFCEAFTFSKAGVSDRPERR